MISGLDYGTSNSALGVFKQQQAHLVDLFNEEKFLPSTLYTLNRNLVCEYIYQNLPSHNQASFKQERLSQLQAAVTDRRDLGYQPNEICQFFGKEAISQYIESPDEGVFIKSPKSFLGSTGLSRSQVQFFEDLVTAMILNIKLKAESQLTDTLSHVVIGRPVNFQGVNSDKSNEQALNIITTAAKKCGFNQVEFLFEPLAAGIDFETHLNKDKTVLVVDIGGGTTDCSIVKMGPSFVNKEDREEDFLAHTGQRIGGNDLDIQLTFRTLMPLFGLGSELKKGMNVPNTPFWTAASINNVGDQMLFSSAQFTRDLQKLKLDMVEPHLLERLIRLQSMKLNHRLVRSAEESKIKLSDFNDSNSDHQLLESNASADVEVQLDYIEEALSFVLTPELFESSIERPLKQIKELIVESVQQAGVHPDLVYITGGTAKSKIVKDVIQSVLPNAPVLDGDYYGSVATGLTKWAKKLWP